MSSDDLEDKRNSNQNVLIMQTTGLYHGSIWLQMRLHTLRMGYQIRCSVGSLKRQ